MIPIFTHTLARIHEKGKKSASSAALINFQWDRTGSLNSYIKEQFDSLSGNVSYLLDYPCGSSNDCAPIYAEFPPGQFLIELWGSQGGNASNTFVGGKGAYTRGRISILNMTTLYFFIGQKGAAQIQSETFNGGGSHPNEGEGRSGGGATDVRLFAKKNTPWSDQTSLASRIMVASGGGGSSYYRSTYSEGGDGGGLNGLDGSDSNQNVDPGYGTISPAKGGAQTSGGSGGRCTNGGKFGCIVSNAQSGNLGKGGNTENGWQSGGGGGFYGGGSSAATTHRIGSGAGGSSYVAGYPGCPINSPSFPLFEEPLMIAGSSKMPSPALFPTNAEATEQGHQGNGAARITVLHLEYLSQVFQQHEPMLPHNLRRKIMKCCLTYGIYLLFPFEPR